MSGFLIGPCGVAPAASPVTFSGPGDSQAFVIWGSVARGYSAAKAALGTTKAFRVVDSGGANGQDILVLTTGLTDVASLNTWIGAHGTASVTTLYDQVGTNDWTQATVANMPTITVSGINGLPTLTFNAANSQSLKTGSTISQGHSFTFEAVTERTSGSTTMEVMSVLNFETDFNFAGSGVFSMYNGLAPLTDTLANGVPAVISGSYAGSSASTLNINGNTQVTGTDTGSNNIAGTMTLGNLETTSLFLTGFISEAGMYAATYNSGVHSNARTAYGL